MVCGATSDAGKSWVVTGLCRLLARRGVRVAPFKGQNMALNAAVVAGGGGEIGHAQWVQARAAGAPAEVAMNPVLLKPTGERTSQVVVMGRAVGEQSAAEYHAGKAALRPTVLAALADLRSRYDVVVCEGAGGAAEINLLAGDFANVPLAAAAGLPVVVVGDIERGGVFASLFGTWALLPDDLRVWVRGFVINRFRGDPSLLGDACAELERRTGVPVLGVVPVVPGTDIDAEDSLALDSWDTEGALVDVAVVRFPRVANFGDLDPLRLEPGVAVRWVRSAVGLGRPDLVVLPGSKNTRGDLDWFRSSGLAAAVEASGAPVVAVCAGAQMTGISISDPRGAEGPPGSVAGLGWLPLRTVFEADKVLDRPTGVAQGERVAGYRIHHGRIEAAGEVEPWIVADDGSVLGWQAGRFRATTLHGLFESDGLRAAVLRWAAPGWVPSGVSFAAERTARFDRIADALEASLDLDALFALIGSGTFGAETTSHVVFAPEAALEAVTDLVPHLRWRVGAPGAGDLVGADLAADPDRLAAEVAATAAGRGSDDPQVLASLWWQAYAYRVAGTTLAAWVVAGGAPDPSAPGTGVGLARSRPSSLLVDPDAELVHDLDDLVKRLFAGHLDPLMAALRARHSAGRRLLHGNAAAGVASALGAVATAEGAPPLRERVDAATAAIARADEADLGRWTGWDYRRTTCCLWWKTSAADGKLCEDCSLRPADPRTGDTSPAPDRGNRHQLPGAEKATAP
ncbi:MAG: adenosylcobyric acid synthase [Actinomycetota bacterium]|nr:adenosylcobyric acid synthase [Actinomycetota bacterium]